MATKTVEYWVDTHGVVHTKPQEALKSNQAAEDGARCPTGGNCPQDPEKVVVFEKKK